MDEHKNDEYEMTDGEIGLLGEAGGNIYVNRDKVACEELWVDFYQKIFRLRICACSSTCI